MEERHEILSKFASTLVNSGHSVNSSRILIVQDVTKYIDNLRLSSLPETHKHYRPMYLSNVYKQSESQINEYLDKMNWFADKEEDG